jgi:NAD-dependent dihydropyrimidine dehydrogenase PreA subunit
MTVRNIVKIDLDKCDGCGDCIVNCPEGALKIIDGKARVVKESYCDGLGACIGVCPLDAITIETREADDFDEAAVEKHMAEAASDKQQAAALPMLEGGCPGAVMRNLQPAATPQGETPAGPSQLTNWPVQLTLVPPGAPFLRDADILLVADCAPFAMSDFHSRILQGRPLVIGCPKLDDAQSYVAKLSDIIEQASPKSLTVVRMEVPCCGGLCQIVRAAMESAGRDIPVKEITVSVGGQIIAEETW